MRVYRDTTFEYGFLGWALAPPEMSALFVVKATFDMVADGPATVADEQVPCMGEVFFEEDADLVDVRVDSDFALLKPQAEWFVVGHARTARATPAPLLPLEVAVGGQTKKVVAYGDRFWKRGMLGATPSDPIPFTQMPLRWSRAFGGPKHPINPIGVGLASVERDGRSLDPLPSFELPGEPILSRDTRPTPAGFGPIPRTWPTRVRLAGTYDERYVRTRWPWLAEDMDFRYFQGAPPDQWRQSPFRGDEPIHLHGFSHEHPVFRTQLPGLRPRLFLEPKRPGADDEEPCRNPDEPRPWLTEVGLQLDTITIDTDAWQVLCVWRGVLRGVKDEQLGDVRRLFYVHEPIGTDRPLHEYQDWFARKLREEALEFRGEEPPPPPELPAEASETAATEEEPDTRSELEKAIDEKAGKLGFLRAVAGAMPPAKLTASDLRLAREVAEQPIDEELAALPDPEDDQVPPSLYRLALHVRRLSGRGAAGADLTGQPLRGMNLAGMCFDGADLTGAQLAHANLEGSSFIGARLERSNLTAVHARKAVFRRAIMMDCQLVTADMRETDLAGAMLQDAVISSGDFRGSTLDGASFENAWLDRALLKSCSMEKTDFDGARLDGADLSDSTMAAARFENANLEGATLARCQGADMDMTGANLRRALLPWLEAPGSVWEKANLNEADLSGSQLDGADFSEAQMFRVKVNRARCRGSRWDRAVLCHGSFIESDLFEASFEGADLSFVDFRGANLYSAQVWRANLAEVRLDGADLSRTLWERGLCES